jgi:hypothetical protein
VEAGTRSSFEVHSGVAELADRYQGLILDQFGVLHNGTNVRVTIPSSCCGGETPTTFLDGGCCRCWSRLHGGAGLLPA